jgi:hypothetical protein
MGKQVDKPISAACAMLLTPLFLDKLILHLLKANPYPKRTIMQLFTTTTYVQDASKSHEFGCADADSADSAIWLTALTLRSSGIMYHRAQKLRMYLGLRYLSSLIQRVDQRARKLIMHSGQERHSALGT